MERPPGFPSKLAELRETRGLTQEELAELIDVGPVTIRNYERGRRRPSQARTAKLAAALQVSTAALFGGDEPQADDLSDSLLTRLELIAILAALDDTEFEQLAGGFGAALEPFRHSAAARIQEKRSKE